MTIRAITVDCKRIGKRKVVLLRSRGTAWFVVSYFREYDPDNLETPTVKTFDSEKAARQNFARFVRRVRFSRDVEEETR